MTYDEIGNPLTIGDISLSWINGRQLNSYITNNLNINYKYNKDGIRTEKNVNGNITKYYVEGNKIIYLQKGNEIIYFLYENDVSIGFKYAGNTYYYVKNIQNDVLGILNSEFEQIVKYEYDSYGKIKSIKDGLGNVITDTNHIAYINPFRYRSYYYDDETGLYYLNSRYYNPTWGRFINADGIIGANIDIISQNLYAYCSNNNVTFIDYSGSSAAIAIGGTAFLTEIAIAIGKTLLSAAAILGGAALTEDIVTNSTYKNSSNSKKSKKSSDTAKEHNVYVLKDDDNEVQYVGRTKNLKATKYRHENNPNRKKLTLYPVYVDLTYNEARILEQKLIEEYKTLKKDIPMNNQINGMSKKHYLYRFVPMPIGTWDESLTYVGN